MKNIREDDPQWVSCDKDTTRRQMEDGEIVECIRFHCASEHHAPIVYGHRLPVAYVKSEKFKTPECPFCHKPMTKGGCPDMEGISIKGPA
jgi:hypothetical protein